jgi:hypothetical protein
MFLEAVLVFCSISNPSQCMEKTYPYSWDMSYVTPYTCMVNAQATAAEYLQDHPDLRLVKWGCNRSHKEPI